MAKKHNNKHDTYYSGTVDGPMMRKHTGHFYGYGMKEVRLICPRCFKLHDKMFISEGYFFMAQSNTIPEVYLSEMVESGHKKDMVYIPKKCCGENTYFYVDVDMAKIISELNKMGYPTSFSCEGHNLSKLGFSCPYIAFTDYVFDTIDLSDPILENLWEREDIEGSHPMLYSAIYLNTAQITIDQYLDNYHIKVFLKYLKKLKKNLQQ